MALAVALLTLGPSTAAAQQPPGATEPWDTELGPSAAPGGGLHYVALGDSFSSGEGEPYVDPQQAAAAEDRDLDDDFIENDLGWLGDSGTDIDKLPLKERAIAGRGDEFSFGGNNCHRSAHGYPARTWSTLEGKDPRWGAAFTACSGAVLGNYWDEFRGEPAQRSALQRQPADLVTVGFGGNDVGFGNIVGCMLGEGVADRLAYLQTAWNPWFYFRNDALTEVDACGAVLDLGLPKRFEDLRRDLGQLLSDVTRPQNGFLKPNAQVIAIGYPRLFPDNPPPSCGMGAHSGIGRDHMLWLNDLVDRINAAVKDEAFTHGVSYVDVSQVVSTPGGDGVRHDFCIDDGGDRWVNRFIPSDLRRSMHPKHQYHGRVAEKVVACHQQPATCDPPDEAESPGSLTLSNKWTDLTTGQLDRTAPGMTANLFNALALDECDVQQDGPGIGTLVSNFATGDLTGDGWDDAAFVVECLGPTSSWPEHVVVLDGLAGPARAEQLGVEISDGRLVGTSDRPAMTLHELTVTVNDDGGLVVAGGARSDAVLSAAGPEFSYRQTFTWSGSRWEVGPVQLTR